MAQESVQPQAQQPQVQQPQPQSQEPQEQEVEAQMVRLSYVEGDVRLKRTILNQDDLKKGWETAVANTAIEEGFGLATGNHGRAEIEFENGSVAYLAENSVLAFDTLETIDNVPLTRLKLVTGTMALSARLVEEEEFYFLVPGTDLIITNGMPVRADSYLDGFIMTPMKENSAGVIMYRNGKLAKAEGAKPLATPAGWNEWVLARQQARDAALPEAMKAAKVDQPFPGLLDLYQNGRFFPCDPYGQCWVPVKEKTFMVSDCWNGDRQIQETTLRDINTGQKRKEREVLWADGPWLPCNYGSWIDYDMGWAWVFDPWMTIGYWPSGGGHRHHRHHDRDHDRDHHRDHDGDHRHHRPGEPVHHPGGPGHHPRGHWVKTDGKVLFVPRHPKDADGKPPVNLKHGGFTFKNKERVPERVNIARIEKFKLLNAPPREVRKIEKAEQRHVAPPPMRARLINDEVGGGKPTPRLIDYDYRSKRFVDRGDGDRPEKPVVLGKINRNGDIVRVPRRDGSEHGPVFGKHDSNPHDGNSNASNGAVFNKDNHKNHKIDSATNQPSGSGAGNVSHPNNPRGPKDGNGNASRGDNGSRDHGFWGRHRDSGNSNAGSSGSSVSSSGSNSGSGRPSGSGSSSWGGSHRDHSGSGSSAWGGTHRDSGSSASSSSGSSHSSSSSSGSGSSHSSGSSYSGSSQSSGSSSSGSSHSSGSYSGGSTSSSSSSSSGSSYSGGSSSSSGSGGGHSGGGGGHTRSN